MPAIQPIPQRTPDPASAQASAVLAKHNRSTDGRVRGRARWNPAVQRGNTPGEATGSRVK